MLARSLFLGALLDRQVRKMKERSLNLDPNQKESRMAYGLPSPTPYHYSTWTLEMSPMPPTTPPSPASYSPPSPSFPHPRFRL